MVVVTALDERLLMLVLGVLLILVAVVVITAVLFGANSAPVGFDLQVLEIETTPMGVFGLGALTLLVLMFGLLAIRLGTRRSLQHRRERKELKRLHAREGRAGDSAARGAHPAAGETPGTATDAAPDTGPPDRR